VIAPRPQWLAYRLVWEAAERSRGRAVSAPKGTAAKRTAAKRTAAKRARES
jgi:hypothetical protein